MRIVLLSASWSFCWVRFEASTGKQVVAHCTYFPVIVTCGKEVLERLFVSKHCSPCKRRETLVSWIWVAQVRSLGESFDQKQVVLYKEFA